MESKPQAVPTHEIIRRELQATSWVEDPVLFLLESGTHASYRQYWKINGALCHIFRFRVNLKTLDVELYDRQSDIWRHSHKLFEC